MPVNFPQLNSLYPSRRRQALLGPSQSRPAALRSVPMSGLQLRRKRPEASGSTLWHQPQDGAQALERACRQSRVLRRSHFENSGNSRIQSRDLSAVQQQFRRPLHAIASLGRLSFPGTTLSRSSTRRPLQVSGLQSLIQRQRRLRSALRSGSQNGSEVAEGDGNCRLRR